MLGRHSARVTYAHKRRRAQNTSKKLFSSPLEDLPPEVDDLTRTQMARRMLKRSRHVALADRSEDKNVEHMRQHLVKRIKRTQEHASSTDIRVTLDMPDDVTLQTPLPTSQSIHESAVENPQVPEQLSPVPVSRRVMSRTSSRNLKENIAYTRTLASPFCSRPGSAASSPRRNGRGRSSRRVLPGSLHAKSRTLSAAFTENTRGVSQKHSSVSVKVSKSRSRHIKHRRRPSSPSTTSYMRSQSAQEGRITPPRVSSCTFDCNKSRSTVRSNPSFHTDEMQYCSTPAISRKRGPSGLHEAQARTDKFPDPLESVIFDIEMSDGTVEKNSGCGETLNRVAHHTARSQAIYRLLQKGSSPAGTFVTEFDIPIADLDCSPAPTTTTKFIGSEGVPKLSVGESPFYLPGTSPADGECLIIRTSMNRHALTPPPLETTTPGSPASDLALEFRSMGIHGDAITNSRGEIHRPTASSLQRRSLSLQDACAPAKSVGKESVGQRPGRNRAGTIRASDISKPGVSSFNVDRGHTSSSVRRTRSGTVVGPESRLATKDMDSLRQPTNDAPTTGLAPVQSGSESESDDELLLKTAWIEDMEYLGLAVPGAGKEVDSDEMNLGGLWHGMESGPPRRLGLRRRVNR